MIVGSNDEFLKWDVAYSIYEVIHKSNVHRYDKRIAAQFNLICAMIDRLHDAIRYLNNFDEAPRTDNELLLCLVHSCVIHDAVKEIHKALGLKYRYDESGGEDNYKYFRPVVSDEMLMLTPGKSFPTDDKFFEHFRSLAFAHPLDTSRANFLEKGNKKEKEIRYSPFVINASGAVVEDKKEKMIGVRVYSNMWNDIKDLYFPFRTWMEFIRDRYELLKGVKKHIEQIVERSESEWRSKKLDRQLGTEELLVKIVEQLKLRHVHEPVLEVAEEALLYYTIPVGSLSPKTKESVILYRKAIELALPQLCDAVDDLDYEKFLEALDPIVDPITPQAEEFRGVGYQREKIFLHLGDEDASQNWWAKRQLRSFAEGFAKRWVDIDATNLSIESAKLLVTVACYHEFHLFAESYPEKNLTNRLPPTVNIRELNFDNDNEIKFLH